MVVGVGKFAVRAGKIRGVGAKSGSRGGNVDGGDKDSGDGSRIGGSQSRKTGCELAKVANKIAGAKIRKWVMV